MQCREGCGACCIALSISSAIPEMPDGKPAGIACVQLTEDNKCKLFGFSKRPQVCAKLQPSYEMCGDNANDAFAYLTQLELQTR